MATTYDNSEQNKLLKNWEKRVQASTSKWESAFRSIDRARRLAGGEVPDNLPDAGLADDTAGLVDASGSPISTDRQSAASHNKVRANLLLATNEAMLPLIYAKNPDVSIKPSEKAGTQGEVYEAARAWSETLEVVTSREMMAGGLKRQAKKAVRSVQTAKVGWLKVTYQREYGQDPTILNRLNDAQENLARIMSSIAELADQEIGGRDEEEAKAQELREMIEGLQESPEVMLAEGHVIDSIPVKHIRMDPNVGCLEDYRQAAWIGHYTDMPVDDYRAQFNVSEEAMKGVKIFTAQPDGTTREKGTWNTEAPAGDGNRGDVRLWEIWHRADNTVYQWCEGAMDFAREPWRPQGLGQRWYPFFLVGFHWIDGEEWPLSDVDLLERLQQEYNDALQQKAEHRKANIPHYIMAGDGVSVEDVTSLTVAGAREIVVVNSQGRPIREILSPSPQIPMNPAMYDTQDIRFDMQWLVGLQDAARGGVVKAKTLGEAEIAEAHLASRAANLRDELEDMLSEMAEYIAQNCILKMSPERVRQIAGENAYWPEMPRQDAFELFDVEIRAGSTGKPDQREEQEQWGALLPHIKELVSTILQLRAQGFPDTSNPFVNILEMTLQRFDERIDLEQILPPQAPQPIVYGGNGQGVEAQQAGQPNINPGFQQVQ